MMCPCHYILQFRWMNWQKTGRLRGFCKRKSYRNAIGSCRICDTYNLPLSYVLMPAHFFELILTGIMACLFAEEYFYLNTIVIRFIIIGKRQPFPFFSENYIAIAVLRLVEEEKCVVEGAGATGIAAALAGLLPELKGKRFASYNALSIITFCYVMST